MTIDQVTRLPATTQTPEDAWARASRLDARRSSVFDLVERNLDSSETREEVATAMTPALRETFSRALRGVRAELAPPDDTEQEVLVVELTRVIALLGGGWPAEQRSEWIEVVLTELTSLPAGHVATAVSEAMRKVRYASDFLPTVVDRVEELASRARAEQATLTKIAEML